MGPATRAHAFRALAARLGRAGVATPELDARLLLCAACEVSHEALAADPDCPLTHGEARALERLAVQREVGRPVSRLLGRREFWGRDFALSDATLDPRPDSETLVAAVLDEVRAAGRGAAPLSVLDLGTGTGCLLLSLLAELPTARGIGVDVREAALAVARANARALGVSGRARFVCGSWLDSICGRFDVIVANPPYIACGDIAGLAPEARCDPRVALDGGTDGLDAYRAIVPGLKAVLASGGIAVLEVGQGQGPAVARLLAGSGLMWRERRDLAGIVRYLQIGVAGHRRTARKNKLENSHDQARVSRTEPFAAPQWRWPG